MDSQQAGHNESVCAGNSYFRTLSSSMALVSFYGFGRLDIDPIFIASNRKEGFALFLLGLGVEDIPLQAFTPAVRDLVATYHRDGRIIGVFKGKDYFHFFCIYFSVTERFVEPISLQRCFGLEQVIRLDQALKSCSSYSVGRSGHGVESTVHSRAKSLKSKYDQGSATRPLHCLIPKSNDSFTVLSIFIDYHMPC